MYSKNFFGRATHVPAGEDQEQQIQIARDLANTFNYRYGETFPLCDPIIGNDASGRIKSLRDPSKKMSKSDPDPKSRILVTDRPEQIVEKLKKAVTDFTSAVYNDPKTRPGVSNLITIHSLMSGMSIEEIEKDASSLDTGKYVIQKIWLSWGQKLDWFSCSSFRYKFRVADAVVDKIDPIRIKIEDYLKHPEYLVDILKIGTEKCTQIAEETLVDVKKKVGLGVVGDLSDFKFSVDDVKVKTSNE